MRNGNTAELDSAALEALAAIHHALFIGLQLMVTTRHGGDACGDWLFKLFRKQHEEKFLASFTKLGLDDLPHAVACAQYHTLSNGVGGVPVEYMYESDQVAWIRFRYPRWMFAGPAICGVTEAASAGFLRGWYAQNGVSLGNPRLGFVCVSQDMTGQFGLCGCFKEFDRELSAEERLTFAPGLTPPPFKAEEQPVPPSDQWNAARLAKAKRNYALEYIRNGLATLPAAIGLAEARVLVRSAARLIGLQYARETSAGLGIDLDLGPDQAVNYLVRMLSATGDELVVGDDEVAQFGLRLIRDTDHETAELLADCWAALWGGVMDSCRQRIELTCEREADCWRWVLRQR